jgi:hypothetical protein
MLDLYLDTDWAKMLDLYPSDTDLAKMRDLYPDLDLA